MGIQRENFKMVGKLCVIALGMFAFGYALVPIYRHICEGIISRVVWYMAASLASAAEAMTNLMVWEKERIGPLVHEIGSSSERKM